MGGGGGQEGDVGKRRTSNGTKTKASLPTSTTTTPHTTTTTTTSKSKDNDASLADGKTTWTPASSAPKRGAPPSGTGPGKRKLSVTISSSSSSPSLAGGMASGGASAAPSPLLGGITTATTPINPAMKKRRKPSTTSASGSPSATSPIVTGVEDHHQAKDVAAGIADDADEDRPRNRVTKGGGGSNRSTPKPSPALTGARGRTPSEGGSKQVPSTTLPPIRTTITIPASLLREVTTTASESESSPTQVHSATNSTNSSGGSGGESLSATSATAISRASRALQEEATGSVSFNVVLNDDTDDSLILLTGLKNIFQKQLPMMPKEYIARLVYDKQHAAMAVVKHPRTVLGGITYRPFPERDFAEIVFCAIASTEQVQGYGSRLMMHVKDYVFATYGIRHFLTYADNYAIGYFKKQGFTTDISLSPSNWMGYIKDYEGGTLMMCRMVEKVKYLHVHEIIAAQRKAVLDRIKSMSKSHIIHPGIKDFSAIKPLQIPGVRESGWTPELSKLLSINTVRPKGPLYKLLKKMVTELQEHQQAWPFLKPVSGVPDYYNIIKHPMDLQTLDENVEEEKYPSADAFITDTNLIFSNCKLYNEDGTQYTRCAKALEKWFKERFRVLRAEASL